MTDGASDKDVANALGEEFVTIGNKRVVGEALADLNRVDITELSDSQLRAYSETLGDMSWLRESLDETQYEVTD